MNRKDAKKALQPVNGNYHHKPEGFYSYSWWALPTFLFFDWFFPTFSLILHPRLALRADRLLHICVISAFRASAADEVFFPRH